MSKPAQALRCSRCGMALSPKCTRCSQCGQRVILRSDSGVPASDGGAHPPVERGEPKRGAARGAARGATPSGAAETPPLTPTTRVSAALPRRLTAADPNGARNWGLSASVAVILFGFAIGFGTFVAMSEH
ncbi:MAG: hypothetical protein QOH33_2442, partial [Paraburkholderia sp.]|nr:hypothetical protein [Paraburkholderia sp.]